MGTTDGAQADTDVDTPSATLKVSGVVVGTGTITQGVGVATSIAGTYGHLTLNADGSYTYIADTANSLAQDVSVTDTFSYTVNDQSGTATAVSNSTTLTFTVTGTNDAAVITGTSTAALTETNAVQTATGTLSATDVDSSNAFVVQTNAAGSNGYGKFSIDATGAWTYTMNSAHNEFVAGTNYTDSLTVTTADGTPQVLTPSPSLAPTMCQ